MYTVFLAERNNPQTLEVKLNNVELIAGILAASIGILEQINHETNNKTEYYMDTNADVSQFRLLHDISEQYIKYATPGQIKPGYFGVWMKGSRRFHYSLYTFQSDSFFQGVISICNAFQINFRNFIYNYPFDDLGNLYTLEGYDLPTRQIAEDALDLDDVEIEERDNENLIELLRKEY